MCERERERERVYVCVCVRARTCAHNHLKLWLRVGTLSLPHILLAKSSHKSSQVPEELTTVIMLTENAELDKVNYFCQQLNTVQRHGVKPGLWPPGQYPSATPSAPALHPQQSPFSVLLNRR